MNADLKQRLEEFNESDHRESGRIVMPNERLAALWLEELLGQISDGAWENHWLDHPDSWQDYHALRISIDTDVSRPVFKQSDIEGDLPDFLARDSPTGDDLVDIIGQRMAEYVREYGHPDYDEEDVRADLRIMNDAKVA